MKNKRYIAFYTVFAICFVLVFSRLVNLQVINGEYYREKSNTRTARSVELIAPRGEILDRNGRAIISNRTGYNVYILSNRDRKAGELNKIIDKLYSVTKEAQNIMEQNLPVIIEDNQYKFLSGSDIAEWKKENNFEKNQSADEIISVLLKKYQIDTEKYSKEKVLKILSTRIDMTKRGFSASSPYLFAEDVPIEAVSVIKEKSAQFPDVSVITQPVRNYKYDSLGAHIIGRVGLISQEEYKENENNGYSINSYIGKSGIERYMEDYLKGTNGSGSIGKGVDNGGHSVEKNPVSGRDVSLTIDLDMQLVAEEALKNTILEISSLSDNMEGGRDANAGSIVVMDVNSGDVLAIASYPSYEIENFSSNYNLLVNDSAKPLFNRALAGTYSPASTFKILVAMAALEENIITTDEEIFDTGKYTYFKDYQPACWIYNQTGKTHGYVNVTEALRDSCNVFFFDVGRRLTIEKINEYAKKFGFGQNSGIELSKEEKTGVVASPENRKKSGGIWYPGDTCQSAIGQSDTLVTPLQLASFVAAVANGGTRYKPHLLKSVKDVEKITLSETKPEVLSKIDIAPENLEAVTKGMRAVVTEGTAYSAFLGCKTPVAAKTGSAQGAGNYTNGICVAYAPYEKPQIAIACVVEKAGNGGKVAKAVRRVVDSYFDNSERIDMLPNTLTR